MERALAIVERDLRRFRRSPTLIVVSLVFPIVQLVVLGYAFGGKPRHLKVGLVDQDGRVPAVQLAALGNAIAANAETFTFVPFDDQGRAVTALRNGRVNGVLTIPPGFSRRLLRGENPRVALIEDNTDNFVSGALASTFTGMVSAYGRPGVGAARTAGVGRVAGGAARMNAVPTLDIVEVYPYVPYIQYLLPGSIVMSIFMMVMIGGGIIFIDDKARGLHEGYLVTPITRFELILGFNVAGALKAILAGTVLMFIGSLIAGVPHPFDPMRLMRLFLVISLSSVALVSMMFLFMVRMEDPLVPRAIFGVLNTLLFFPSGAVYPQSAFPAWMRGLAVADPFTYVVHALKALLLKNTGFAAITGDLIFLTVFSAVTMTLATFLFKREL
ncbi:MAG TPA: ABC transporter permease [Gemmatimonadota bacterium]|nr:ABC transporter permease [Gemmatimonadota bacterium]